MISIQTVFFNLAIECPLADIQRLRSAASISLEPLEGADDHASLHLVEGNEAFTVIMVFRIDVSFDVACRVDGSSGLILSLIKQMSDLHDITLYFEERPVDQFAFDLLGGFVCVDRQVAAVVVKLAQVLPNAG